MSYKDLQDEAKEFGLKHVGVSKGGLKKAIAEKRSETSNSSAVEKELYLSKETPEPKNNKKLNVAVVRNVTNQEIRKYTAEIHGDKFADLANEFASKHEYNVELVEAKENAICPRCGHILD